MRIAIIGGAGFIGTNLSSALAQEPSNIITVIDKSDDYFSPLLGLNLSNVTCVKGSFEKNADFDMQVRGNDVIYHLAATNFPGNSNKQIPEELDSNVTVTAQLLDACVRQNVKKVIFVSSGGAVYGKKGKCPINEDMVTYPITSYGIQKMVIEKLLYLYRYQKGLDYRVIRLANPYGPYQRPNGKLGVVTTFIYEALTNGVLDVYGDGSVVRDFIYIDDAIRGIKAISDGNNELRVFNLGSGIGTSINQVVEIIKHAIRNDIVVNYHENRPMDVDVNYLDISRYEETYGKLKPITLREGILKTADFLRKEYGIK